MIRDVGMKTLAATILCMFVGTSMLVMIPGTTHAAPTDGWIEGTVSDGVDPIPNVLLIYILNMGGGGNPLGAGWTDINGHYNLTVTGGLNYMVLAFEGSYYSSAATASVVSGATATADIVMTPIAPTVADVTLHGFVKDEMGNPVTEGSIIGYTNDPLMTGGGPPYYGNITAPDGLGEYSVNVIAGSAGGGVGIMGVTGYGFIDNSTSDPFVSGMSYWLNITLFTEVSTDDAVLHGNITDSITHSPLDNVLVSFESSNEWNMNRSYSNSTFTDSVGHYEMNVTNGTSYVTYSRVGYSMYRIENLQIDPGTETTIDLELIPTVAIIKGNVTDFSSGLPIANAQVFLTDMLGNFTIATTNSSGAYVLDAFAGIGLAVFAQANGYVQSATMVNISSGDTLWYDFGLQHVDAWMAGRITDAITGAPIQNANINVYNGSYNEWANTNTAGDYNITAIMSGNYSVSVNAMNYRQFFGEVQLLPGGNVYDVQLMPMDIPDTCRLWGFVTDGSGSLSGAKVETGMGAPDFGEYNNTVTDGTGYYEMWIPAIPLTYVVSAHDHAHAQGTINATGMTDVQLDIVLAVDTWSPNITYDQSPLENVSWTNPTVYDIAIQEQDPSSIVLAQFLYLNSSLGFDNYYLVEMAYDSFDPLSQSGFSMPFTIFDDNYTINYTWSALSSGGRLSNGLDSKYLGSYEFNMGPETYDAIRGFYTNSSMMGSWETGTAWFDRSTGDLVMFQFDGPTPGVDASDPTGLISPSVNWLQVDTIGNSTSWIPDMMMGEWSVVGLSFTKDPIVPSGNWLSVFSVGDFGDHGNGVLEFFTVDNEPPVPDWGPLGPDQQAIQNITRYLDGGNCSDNVGIVDYAWSFWDDGTYYDIHGAVVTHIFTELGDHNVTLTVTDGAGHVNSTNGVITVIPDPPPVPYAGPDQLVLPGTVTFDASGSYDVGGGIVNWTWTFTYDGDEQTLWGPSPTFDFLIEGVYNVTLTVNDTAGQTATDTVQITVSSVIPEFPTLLIPISGMLLLMVIVGTIRRRRQ
jgi:hypothetical protein